jgi:hypothetical protein
LGTGCIYYFLHSQCSFPNTVMRIIVGYFGKDFLEALFERLRPLLKPGGGA